MKKIISLTLILFCVNAAFSQKAVDRKHRLFTHVTERYQAVIGDKKEIRQGKYEATYKDIVIAQGQYIDDKKSGIWHFYDKEGNRVEDFDYDNHKLLNESVEDTTSNFRYRVEAELKPGDVATKPIKVGGRYFGYISYLKLCQFPVDVVVGNSFHRVQLELLISPLGRVAQYKAHIYIDKQDIVSFINTDNLSEEDKTFIPATLNGQPITSTIIIQCYTSGYNEIDMMN